MATVALVVQVTGRALPCVWLLVPVGAVTVIALKPAAVTFTVPGEQP